MNYLLDAKPTVEPTKAEENQKKELEILDLIDLSTLEEMGKGAGFKFLNSIRLIRLFEVEFY